MAYFYVHIYVGGVNMGYSFMTLEKVKNMNQIIGKYKHNYREIDVLNADPTKKALNEELVGLDGKTYKEAFEERMASLGYGKDKRIRSNAVYGFEVVTTFSREEAEHMDFDKWKENNVKWLRQAFNANPEKYGDNVLSVVYHADEPGNVHCHAFIVPIDDKGNLNSRYYVQSRQKMIELQNSYGNLMKKEHNLERGIPHSKASHQDIKRYYTALNMTVARELPDVKEHESAMEYRKRVNELYKDVCLKIMGLEDQNRRLKLSQEQTVKNAVSAVKKEMYETYQEKSEHMDELEREFGSFTEVKEKCENYDNLIRGIAEAEEEQKNDFISIANTLIENGYKAREKEKKVEKSL